MPHEIKTSTWCAVGNTFMWLILIDIQKIKVLKQTIMIRSSVLRIHLEQNDVFKIIEVVS